MNNLMKLKEKKLMNLKKNDKGFTLIEMVIVLVIIAILVAILVPSMMGWIKDAKQKSFETEARNMYTAVVSAASNEYAANDAYPTAIATIKAEVEKKIGTTLKGTQDIKWKMVADGSEMSLFFYDNGSFNGYFDLATGKWHWSWESGYTKPTFDA